MNEEVKTITKVFATIWIVTILFAFVAMAFLSVEWFYITMAIQLFSVYMVITTDKNRKL